MLTLPASLHSAPSTFIFKDLATASHVFLRQGALQVPFVRPYKVLHRGEKTYSTEVHGAVMTASNDCLKLAYVLHVSTKPASPLVIPSSIMTRSGQRVRAPNYLGVQQSQHGGGVADTTD